MDKARFLIAACTFGFDKTVEIKARITQAAASLLQNDAIQTFFLPFHSPSDSLIYFGSILPNPFEKSNFFISVFLPFLTPSTVSSCYGINSFSHFRRTSHAFWQSLQPNQKTSIFSRKCLCPLHSFFQENH